MKIILILFALCLVPSQSVFAEKNIESIEYFDNRYLVNHELPVVCFYEPETFNNGWSTEVLYEVVKEALNDWVFKLEEASDTQDVWDIQLKYIANSTSYGKPTQMFMKECDVNILFLGAPILDIDNGSYYKGGVRHIRGMSAYSDMILFTWDYFVIDPRTLNMTQMKEIYGDNISDTTKFFEARPTNLDILSSTIKHELGHSFGLKHHQLNGKVGYSDLYEEYHSRLSIMYYLTPKEETEAIPLKQITEFDTMAIMAKYGTDGWGGITNLKIYEYKKM